MTFTRDAVSPETRRGWNLNPRSIAICWVSTPSCVNTSAETKHLRINMLHEFAKISAGETRYKIRVQRRIISYAVHTSACYLSLGIFWINYCRETEILESFIENCFLLRIISYLSGSSMVAMFCCGIVQRNKWETIVWWEKYEKYLNIGKNQIRQMSVRTFFYYFYGRAQFRRKLFTGIIWNNLKVSYSWDTKFTFLQLQP